MKNREEMMLGRFQHHLFALTSCSQATARFHAHAKILFPKVSIVTHLSVTSITQRNQIRPLHIHLVIIDMVN